jgi:hypothetical protein
VTFRLLITSSSITEDAAVVQDYNIVRGVFFRQIHHATIYQGFTPVNFVSELPPIETTNTTTSDCSAEVFMLSLYYESDKLHQLFILLVKVFRDGASPCWSVVLCVKVLKNFENVEDDYKLEHHARRSPVKRKIAERNRRLLLFIQKASSPCSNAS